MIIELLLKKQINENLYQSNIISLVQYQEVDKILSKEINKLIWNFTK